MSDNSAEDFDDSPIIQYANRIQKLMTICTSVLYDGSPALTRVKWLLALINNYPPSGKEHLKKELEQLRAYPNDTYTFSRNQQETDMALEVIYGKAHDWFYTEILQDMNKARPLFRKPGSLSEGNRYSDSQRKGLGETTDA